MDSSAFHVWLIPVCQGVGLGLITGMAVRLTLGWLAAWIDRAVPAGQDRLILGQEPAPAWSPTSVGDSRVARREAF